MRLCNIQIVLVNVYAPNIDDHKFFEHLFDTQGPQLLVRPCFGLSLVKSALHIHYFFSTYIVRDIWQNLDATDSEYSLFSNVHHTFSRIEILILGLYFFLG